ncbi:hypothetical protein EYF80_018072 [Liparis tanakae]|uniref:Uncharacterized protein n=1 Tax=Liparis tanakae TaxID=230148 RepID=A0A4Z2I1N0_9TELE|nr:hypothetical protein EYF80_018072 [Liparis tanakae]
MVLAAPRWNMTTSSSTSAASHGSAPPPTATLFSIRARRGMTWGKLVLDSGQLSGGRSTETIKVMSCSPPLTWGSSSALMTAVKPNMSPVVVLSSAAIWMSLCSRPARSSVEPVQPRSCTASAVAMVWNLRTRSSLNRRPCGNVSNSIPELTPIILCSSGVTSRILASW